MSRRGTCRGRRSQQPATRQVLPPARLLPVPLLLARALPALELPVQQPAMHQLLPLAWLLPVPLLLLLALPALEPPARAQLAQRPPVQRLTSLPGGVRALAQKMQRLGVAQRRHAQCGACACARRTTLPSIAHTAKR